MSRKNIFDDVLYKPVLFIMVVILGSIVAIGITNASTVIEENLSEFFSDKGEKVTNFEFSELFKKH